MYFTINYFAVFAAAITSMIIGSLWYGPLFGKTWMRLSGLTDTRLAELKKRGMRKIYMISFIMSLIMAYVLAHFVAIWGAVGVAGAFQLAFWIWLGFVVTIVIAPFLWEDKPIKLYFLNITYSLVSLFAMALVLVFWR